MVKETVSPTTPKNFRIQILDLIYADDEMFRAYEDLIKERYN